MRVVYVKGAVQRVDRSLAALGTCVLEKTTKERRWRDAKLA